ncbi:hypothetical protein RIF29_00639 [Crotalaria pallida]|uniref:Uncharacterized protein n=1 Tax=Crotalaria pallida TaxID=3830 RepID=A0AAN9IVS8_CROPI
MEKWRQDESELEELLNSLGLDVNVSKDVFADKLATLIKGNFKVSGYAGKKQGEEELEKGKRNADGEMLMDQGVSLFSLSAKPCVSDTLFSLLRFPLIAPGFQTLPPFVLSAILFLKLLASFLPRKTNSCQSSNISDIEDSSSSSSSSSSDLEILDFLPSPFRHRMADPTAGTPLAVDFPRNSEEEESIKLMYHAAEERAQVASRTSARRPSNRTWERPFWGKTVKVRGRCSRLGYRTNRPRVRMSKVFDFVDFDAESSLSPGMARRCISHPHEFILPPNAGAYDWVDLEVLGTPSALVNSNLSHIRANILPCPTDEAGTSYTISAPSVNDRVCTSIEENHKEFFMYEEVVIRLGVKMPFSDLEIALLQRLLLAPTQLHPSGWAFVRAFQKFCEARRLRCSLRAFLWLYIPQINIFEKGSTKRLWVSLKARNDHALFAKFIDSWKTFKPLFFKYQFIGEGDCWFMEDGHPRFPLSWMPNFFNRHPKLYQYHYNKELTDAESHTCDTFFHYLKQNGQVDIRNIIIFPQELVKAELGGCGGRVSEWSRFLGGYSVCDSGYDTSF